MSKTVLWGAGALLAGALIAGIVALFAFGSHKSSAVNQNLLPTTPASTQAPPPGALVLGAEAGQRAVALAIQPKTLTATVLAPSGGPESGLKVTFRVGGSSLTARPCGSGCYRASVEARPKQVDVVVPGGSASFRIPEATSPGASIVARATRAIRSLRSLVYVESLRSGPTGGIVTTWSMAAPDKLTYRIHDGGAAAVVIGTRRWDRAKPGARWVASPSPTLHVPVPTWGGSVTNARVLGSASVNGRPAWIVAFATPSVPAWFTAWIDKRDYRPLQMRMTAAAHFMFHRYTKFNAPLKIVPPK